jgi:Porin subfamily
LEVNMKLGKSLILGSAAGLVVISGAQAADLPIKAKAVEYVRICSLYGAGFFYIPGSDTCIKLGGYAQASMAINTNSVYTGNSNGAGGANNRFTNAFTWRSRSDLTVDTRTATELGVVRTFADVVFTWTTDTYAGLGNGATVYAPLGSGATAIGGTNNASQGLTSYGNVGVYQAFIQFAGFIIGKTNSAFDAPWGAYPGNNFDGLVGGSGTATSVNQFTYTAQFGNGVSGTISAQDPTQYTQAGVLNISTAAVPVGGFVVGAAGLGAFGASDYAGSMAPDIIGSLKVDQAWGIAQLSVAAHDNRAAYYGGTEPTGHPDDKWGWAIQGALQIKNIPTGAGDTINIQGVYTDGATRYNIQNLAGGYGANAIYGSTGLAGAYQSIGFGTAPDTVFGVGTQQQTIQTWGMRGAFNHNWDPYWSSALYGAYAAVKYNDTAKALVCGVGGVGGSFRATTGLAGIGGAAAVCNPDYAVAQLGFITRWTPVKNLTFSADFTYSHLDQKMFGVVNAASVGIGKPAAAYELKDQDTYQMLLRAQRNF